jgi:2-polyprenyl-3-methyl-5-hydroxy-6-metoxy-1,4-benzoquinol methylase
MTDNEKIETLIVNNCLLCKHKGEDLYTNLSDRLFGVSGLWNFLRCPNCGFIWLSPRPVSDDLGKTYKSYLTHDKEANKSRLEVLQEKIAHPILRSLSSFDENGVIISHRISYGYLMSKIPFFNDVARRYVMNLNVDKKGGRLLDVGCGDGKFLYDMKKLGWNVEGVEPDLVASRIAKDKFALSVFTGTLQNAGFGSNTFDAITMKHVIEHVEDPIAIICECHRILKPGGILSIATPNIECLQHRLFISAWLELDPPRHLQLFSLNTLKYLIELAAANNFQFIDLRTVPGNTAQISIVSREIKKKGRWEGKELTIRQMIAGILFWIVEGFIKIFSPNSGEEILMTIKKKK